MGEDYCCTPLLNKRKAKDDILSHKQTLLVSSSQHFSDEKDALNLVKEANKYYKKWGVKKVFY